MADEKNTNPEVMVVHFAIGLDLIGSKTSLHYQKYDIRATAIGIVATSRQTGRRICVPYSNVRGFELMPEGGAKSVKAGATVRAEQALAEARADMVKRGQRVLPPPQVAEPVEQESEEEQMAKAQEARKEARRLAKEASVAAIAKAKAEDEARQAQK